MGCKNLSDRPVAAVWRGGWVVFVLLLSEKRNVLRGMAD